MADAASDFLDAEQKRHDAAQRDDLASKATLNPYVAAGLSGLTFGLGDEATAGVRSMAGSTSYDDALAQERANLSKVRDEHPGYALGSELAGGLPWMLASRGATAPVSLARAGAEAAGSGALWGGLTGFGEAQGGAANRAEGAGEGIGLGAILGGPMGVLLHGTLPGVSALKDRVMKYFNPAGAAEQKIVQNITDRTPGGMDAAATAVKDYNAAEADRVANQIPSPRRTLAEVTGDQTKAGLDAILQLPGEGASAVRTALTDRQGDRLNRVGDAITATFGDASPAFVERQKLYAQRRADAGPLYQQAFDNAGGLTTQDFALLKRIPAEAFTDAKKIAQTEGRTLAFNPEFDSSGSLMLKAGQELPTAQDMHYIKVGLQNTIDKNTGLDQKVNTYGGRLIGLRDDVESRLNDLTRDPNTGQSLYQKATEAWAEPSGRLRAQDLGTKAHDKDPTELQDALGKMSQAEKDSFVNGYMQSLRAKLAKVSDIGTANPVKQIFATPQQREVANIVMQQLGLTPGQTADRFLRLANYMENETGGAKAETDLLRGSQTASRNAWMQDLAVPAARSTGLGALTMAVGGSPTHALLTAGTNMVLSPAMKAVQTRAGEAVNSNMARMLGATDPAAQEAAMKALAERAAAMRLATQQDRMRRATAAGIPAGFAGRNTDLIFPPNQ